VLHRFILRLRIRQYRCDERKTIDTGLIE
jgi:hypothetical protein